MTTDSRRRGRPSKTLLRTWAWLAGAISFFGAATATAVDSTPSARGAETRTPDVVVRHVTRRVVIHSVRGTGAGLPEVTYVPPPTTTTTVAPAPPPVATTTAS